MTEPESAPEPTASDVRRLTALLEKHDLTELRYEQNGVRVTLRTAAFFREQASGIVTIPAAPAPGEPAPTPPGAETEPDAPPATAPGIPIEAPIMGVFYRSATPTDPPFVEIGDAVSEGQVVGLIEAMKVFSEIKSETAGVVRSIPVINKALVQPGDALVILDAA